VSSMEETFNGKEALRVFTILKDETIYVVLLETDGLDETVIVYRTMTCDKGMLAQEHQYIYKAISKTGAINKSIKENGSIQVIKSIVDRACKSPTNNGTSKHAQARKRYVAVNQRTGNKHYFDKVKDLACFLDIKYTVFKEMYAKKRKSTDKVYFDNKDGVVYLITIEVGVKEGNDFSEKGE
jgi:hypothetical protein